jgi:phosphoglycerate dehydrogenase-like enzyme
MKIGIQLTKDKKKYQDLLSILRANLDSINGLEFFHIGDDNNLKIQINNLDILVTYSISKNVFSYKSDKLKWIHFGAAGIEKSLFSSILKSKTLITNACGVHANPVSEFTMGILLYLSKQFIGCEKFNRSGNWTQWELAPKTIQLKDKIVGIVGFGNIGKAIAKKAKAFNMKVIATRRLQKKIEHKKIVDKLIPLADIDYLLRNSDYVVIACPLTPLTKGMIGKNELAKMKSSAFIINIARGAIIDESTLINSLQQKQITGAGLDVFSAEPLDKDNPLFKLDNVFLSPHISGNFPEYQKDVVIQFTDNLNRFIADKDLKNRVCKKRLY